MAMSDRIIKKSDVDNVVARAYLGIKAADGREPNMETLEEFIGEFWNTAQNEVDLKQPLGWMAAWNLSVSSTWPWEWPSALLRAADRRPRSLTGS